MANLLRLEDVEQKVKFKRAKIYQMIKAGKFPRPEKIGIASRWKDDEVDRWITNQGWHGAANG